MIETSALTERCARERHELTDTLLPRGCCSSRRWESSTCVLFCICLQQSIVLHNAAICIYTIVLSTLPFSYCVDRTVSVLHISTPPDAPKSSRAPAAIQVAPPPAVQDQIEGCLPVSISPTHQYHHPQCVRQFLVYLHDRRLIPTSIAVVRSTENRHHVPVLSPAVPCTPC